MGPQALPWEAVSRRVGELLAERGHAEAKSTAEAMYEVLYRAESMMSVHGGVDSLIGHFDMPVAISPPPSIGILEVRREPEESDSARILWAASLECRLARAVAEEFGLRYDELDRLGALFGDEE